jgi:hypothetical protein
MGVLITLCGLGAALTAVVGYFVPTIRRVEEILPDHDQLPLAEPVAAD